MLSENWTKLNFSSRNTILAGLAVIALICLYNWIVKPHTAYLQAAQRYDSVTDELNKKNRSLLGKIKTDQKELEKLQDKFEQRSRSLFRPAQSNEFFSDIRNICEEANCVMKSLKFQTGKSVLESDKSAEEDYITTEHSTLDVVGRYKNIVSLVNKLQQRPQRVWIDSLSIYSN